MLLINQIKRLSYRKFVWLNEIFDMQLSHLDRLLEEL